MNPTDLSNPANRSQSHDAPPAPSQPGAEEWNRLIAAEEAKRERMWNPAKKWQAMQEMMTWAEQQSTVRRNTPAACLARQKKLLAGIAEWSAAEQNAAQSAGAKEAAPLTQPPSVVPPRKTK